MSDAEDPKPVGRPFPKGEPGCRAGRRGVYPPEERRRRKDERLRKKAEKHRPAIDAKLCENAAAGDLKSMELYYKVFGPPPQKPIEAPVAFELPAGATLTEQRDAVMLAVSQGKLTVSQGKDLIGALSSSVPIIDADKTERRLAALEQGRAEAKPRLAPRAA